MSGCDPEFRHPAQCIEAAEVGEEEEKTGKYVVGEVIERIPKFWGERKWDKGRERMDEEETKRLQEAIEGRMDDGLRVRAVGQKWRKTSLVIFDLQDYRTDESEGDTEWDDF
jgi:hypothetical protein